MHFLRSTSVTRNCGWDSVSRTADAARIDTSDRATYRIAAGQHDATRRSGS